MNSGALRVGFLGFGEAAARFASDLARSGITSIAGYSRSGAKAQPGDLTHTRAARAGVQLVRTVGALAKKSDIIIVLTPGTAALAALRKIRKYLRPGQLYVDASATSVDTMARAAALVGDGVRFVDAAIMGPVDVMGIKSPIVASGSHAAAFRDLMTPYGMVINVVGANPGDASAMKLIRSVMTKGLSGILLETLEAARRRNILDAVIADLAVTFNTIPFEKIIKRYTCGTAVHCGRRIPEMKECLDLLRAMGATDRMTRSTIAMLRDMVTMGMPQQFPVEADSVHPVIDAVISARDKGS